MKQLFDFLPLILFFIIYKMDPRSIEVAGHAVTLGGIYSATFILIISTVLIYGFQLIRQKKLDRSQVITLIAVILFGGLTLGFHSDTFIKWKAPVINWIFGIAFLLSPYIGREPLIKRMMGHAMILPEHLWKRLNISWALFFLALGTANLYVAFTFEDFWVDFKIFGSLGLTLLFIIGQFIILGKRIQPIEKNKQ